MLICVGHSHLVAVSSGAKLTNRSIVEFRLRELKRAAAAGQAVGHDELLARINAVAQAEQARQVFSFIGGGTPAIMGMIQHPVAFDFILPDRPDLALEPRAEIIPCDAVRSAMTTLVRRHLRALQRLAQGLSVPLVQVQTPPPVASSEKLRSLAVSHAREIALHGLSPAGLRYKLWLLHSHIFREFCKKAGIAFICNPTSVLDSAGFLSEEYCGDFVHGNALYGAALLTQLEGLG